MDKKILKNKNVVDYNPEHEKTLNMRVEGNKYMFPTIIIKENSNVDSIGYIWQNNSLFIQYKTMKKTIEGFELGVRPEPIGYFYHDVPENVYNKLVNAKSKVDFINKYIKQNYMFHREPIGLDLYNLLDN